MPPATHPRDEDLHRVLKGYLVRWADKLGTDELLVLIYHAAQLWKEAGGTDTSA